MKTTAEIPFKTKLAFLQSGEMSLISAQAWADELIANAASMRRRYAQYFVPGQGPESKFPRFKNAADKKWADRWLKDLLQLEQERDQVLEACIIKLKAAC